MPDEALEAVAGGKGHAECKDTFLDRENCWANDGCDFAWNRYKDYYCHVLDRGKG